MHTWRTGYFSKWRPPYYKSSGKTVPFFLQKGIPTPALKCAWVIQTWTSFLMTANFSILKQVKPWGWKVRNCICDEVTGTAANFSKYWWDKPTGSWEDAHGLAVGSMLFEILITQRNRCPYPRSGSSKLVACLPDLDWPIILLLKSMNELGTQATFQK